METTTTTTAQALFDSYNENGACKNSRDVLQKLSLPCQEIDGENGRRKRVFDFTKTTFDAIQDAFRVKKVNGVKLSIKKFFDSLTIKKDGQGALRFEGNALFEPQKSSKIVQNALRRSFKLQIGIDQESIQGSLVSFRFFYLSQAQSFFSKDGARIDGQGNLVK